MRSKQKQTARSFAAASTIGMDTAADIKPSVSLISLTAISPNPWQPRRTFDPSEMQELAKSIDTVGLLQPIVVRKRSVTPCDTVDLFSSVVEPSDMYEIVVGERRYRAHILLGRKSIQAIVKDTSERDMFIAALEENLNREDLSDYEICLALMNIEKNFCSRTEMAEVLCIPRGELYRYFAFIKLPAFVRDDLNINPRLVSRRSAEEIAGVLKVHGTLAVAALRLIWPRVKDGELGHTEIADEMHAAIEKDYPQPIAREARKLFIASEQVGEAVVERGSLFITIDTNVLRDEQVAGLLDRVEIYLNEIQVTH